MCLGRCYTDRDQWENQAFVTIIGWVVNPRDYVTAAAFKGLDISIIVDEEWRVDIMSAFRSVGGLSGLYPVSCYKY